MLGKKEDLLSNMFLQAYGKDNILTEIYVNFFCAKVFGQFSLLIRTL